MGRRPKQLVEDDLFEDMEPVEEAEEESEEQELILGDDRERNYDEFLGETREFFED